MNKKDNNNQYTIFIDCECFNEVLAIRKWKDESGVDYYINIYRDFIDLSLGTE